MFNNPLNKEKVEKPTGGEMPSSAGNRTQTGLLHQPQSADVGSKSVMRWSRLSGGLPLLPPAFRSEKTLPVPHPTTPTNPLGPGRVSVKLGTRPHPSCSPGLIPAPNELLHPGAKHFPIISGHFHGVSRTSLATGMSPAAVQPPLQWKSAGDLQAGRGHWDD